MEIICRSDFISLVTVKITTPYVFQKKAKMFQVKSFTFSCKAEDYLLIYRSGFLHFAD